MKCLDCEFLKTGYKKTEDKGNLQAYYDEEFVLACEKDLEEKTCVSHKKTNTVKMNVPREVKSILWAFKCFRQEGLIVGGAVRDTILGKPIKDWDLVIPVTGYNRIEINELAIHARNWGMSMQDITEDNLYSDIDSGVYSIMQLMKEGLTIEVIFYKGSALQYVEKFNCHLAMVAHDVVTQQTYISKKFLDAVEAKELRAALPEEHKYIQRMKLKFPDYTYKEVAYERTYIRSGNRESRF